jgi:hypothetical protein
MKTQNLNKHQVAILIATILFVLALFLFSCEKEELAPNQPQAIPVGTWVNDTIIVNAPALHYDELVLISDTLTITSTQVLYSDGFVQSYVYKPFKLKFTPGSEYRPANAIILEYTPNRMVWDTNEKHRRIRRILRKI